MNYPFRCTECQASGYESRPVEERDHPGACAACGGETRRDVGAQLRGLQVRTPRYFSACTRSDLLPTREEAAAMERNFAEFRKPEKQPNPFDEARKLVAQLES